MFKRLPIKSILSTVLLTGLLVGAIPPQVQADTDTMLELLKILKDKGSLTQQEYNLLANAAREEKGAAVTVKEEVQKQVAEKTKDIPKINTRGKFEIKSRDGDFKWRLGGRIMADSAFYDDSAGTTGTESSLGSGSEFRRARLYMSGTLWKDWDFKAQFDWAENKVSGKDLYLRYTGLKPAKITVGNHKEPFSMEELTSSKYMIFMERGLPVIFAPSRNLGISVHTHFNDSVTLSGGFFGEGVSDSSTTSEGYGVTGRVTYAPIHDGDRAVHLGSAVSWRTPNGDDSLRFKAVPESHISNTKLVDTGSLAGIDDYFRYNFEAAAVVGPFSIQGEYIAANLSREAAFGSDLDFDGWFLQGSWFLTGESRHYDWKGGAFKQVKVLKPFNRGGIGAWEVGIRFSSLNLTDGAVIGGEEDDLTVALNWYPNQNMRFMANYVQVLDLDRPGYNLDGAEPGVFQVRAQVHW